MADCYTILGTSAQWRGEGEGRYGPHVVRHLIDSEPGRELCQEAGVSNGIRVVTDVQRNIQLWPIVCQLVADEALVTRCHTVRRTPWRSSV